MAKVKKPTEQTTHKKQSYIPAKKGQRIQWASNLKAKLAAYGAQLGLSAAEISAVSSFLDAYILAETDLANAKTTVKNKGKNLKTAFKNMSGSVRPVTARMKKHSAYTPAIGKDLGIEGADHIIVLPDYAPVIKKIYVESGFIKFVVQKGVAETYNVYARLKGQGDWVLIAEGRKYSPFKDARPLADPKVSETREYKVRGVFGDHEIGSDSNIVSIAYGG